MKKLVYITILGVVFSLSLSVQQKDDEIFYYCFNEKIFINQRTDRIFVKFAPNADREQLHALIDGDTYLQSMSGTYFDEGYLQFAVLEAKDGRQIPSSTIESLMIKPEVITATYMFLNRFEKIQAFTDEFVIMLKPTTSYAQLQELAEKYHCTVSDEDMLQKNVFVLIVSEISKLDARQMANLFQETGLFEYSAPCALLFDAPHSIDTYWGDQWGLKNTRQYGGTLGMDINAEQAWTITQGSPNIKIAVIDNGVELNHPDLQANLLMGYDATTGISPGGAPLNDDENHGTACAGIIGAIKDNGIGISGVAPNCKIIPVRAYRSITYDKVSAKAIRWAWKNGADVISCSWGGGDSKADLINAIDSAVNFGRGGLGCVVVFSTGNDGKPMVEFPASLPNVIAVGAISPCGERKTPTSCDGERFGWGGSNYGSDLNVVAPGVLISTTDRQGNKGYNPMTPIGHVKNGGSKVTADYADQNYNIDFRGTSAACPHVAGVAALVLSERPDLTAAQVRQSIESSCTKITGPSSNPYTYTNGKNDEVGYGLANAYGAIQEAYRHPVNPIITGTSDVVCYDGSRFKIKNPPSGQPITWTISDTTLFSVSPTTGDSTTVTRKGSGNGSATLHAKVGIAFNVKKLIYACPAPVIVGSNTVCYEGSSFKLDKALPNLVWTVTGPFSFSAASPPVTTSSATQPTVYRTTASGTTGWLTATGGVNSSVVVKKEITACPAPVISGSTSLCIGTTTTFNATNLPQGYTWDKSLHFTGSGPTFTAQSAGAGSVSILLANGTQVATHNVTILSPTISGPTNLTVGNLATFSVTNPPQSYTWDKSIHFTGSGPSFTAQSAGAGSVYIKFNGTQVATHNVTITTIPIEIDGPDYICSYGYYYMNGGQTATWSISPGYSIWPTTGVMTNVYPDGGSNQNGTLTATVNGVPYYKSITSFSSSNCPFPATDFVYMTDLACGAYVQLNPYPSNNDPYAMYKWDVIWEENCTYNVSSGSVSHSVDVWFSNNATGALRIDAYQYIYPYGYTPYPVVEYRISAGCSRSGSSFVKAYPNPVSDILTVDVNALVYLSPAFSRSRSSPTITIRLYGSRGNLLRQSIAQGGMVQFNVSNLIDGLYYLHVYDGVNSTPIMLPIIVEH